MSKRSLTYRLGTVRNRAQSEVQRPISTHVQTYLHARPVPAVEPESPAEMSDERRRTRRVAMISEVTVRRIGGFNFQVALSNVSPGGCNVELIEEAEVGDSVIARFPQLEPLGSRVCWIDGRKTGIEFFNNIHPAVFDHLVDRLPKGDAA